MDKARVASAVIEAWPAHSRWGAAEDARESLPPRPLLEQFLRTAFEASLLREEGRPLNFRLALRDPERLPPADDPSTELYRVPFDTPRPFTRHELRRLSPAVDYDRSLLGVSIDAAGELQIWGIIHSGPRWVEEFRGGRGKASNLPDCLIVAVRSPGSLVIGRGPRPLCHLEAAVLQTRDLNVFNSQWFAGGFASAGEDLLDRHTAERGERGDGWSNLDPGLSRMVTQQMMQRLISTIQRSQHGGTLLVVPSPRGDELTRPNPLVHLKYRFAEERSRARFSALVVQVMNTLVAKVPPREGGTLHWDDYASTTHREVMDLDEAIFEMSHLIGTLTAVDGAVLVTRQFELLGFGGEIAGALPEVQAVAQALDLEGETYRLETTEDVGTRHRSVYRLCNALHDVMGIVVSQDGGVRFIRWQDPHVMYWSHTTITPQ